MHFLKQSEMYGSTNLINLHPNEYSQWFHYYPFVVKVDRCVASFNILNNFSNKYVFQIKQNVYI